MGKRLKSSLISLKQLSERIKNGDISPVDLVEVCFDRIKKFNPTLDAFISIIEKDALYKQTQMSEIKIKRGKMLWTATRHSLFNKRYLLCKRY
jgi:aspartyl-tRNA(Asn)/glutamyl-tRNA(Gln) amidotransferase subunit A